MFSLRLWRGYELAPSYWCCMNVKTFIHKLVNLKLCRLHSFWMRTQRTQVRKGRVQTTFASKIHLMQQHLYFFSFLLLFLITPCYSATQPTPKILSALYGYDGCIGGVNNFSTEEEYLQELKRFADCQFVNFENDTTLNTEGTVLSWKDLGVQRWDCLKDKRLRLSALVAIHFAEIILI